MLRRQCWLNKMTNDSPPENLPSGVPPNGGPPPVASVAVTVPPAVRQRLQAVYERATRCVEKGDHDYANDLLTQCLVEDPGNLVYLQAFLANLAQKYGNNKKGARFSALKIKTNRMSLQRASDKGEWQAAFEAGASALKNNPWDTGTLVLLARACAQQHYPECQLYYLRWALDIDAKDPVVNREAALALASMGHFDQAIGCWRRVQQAKPEDLEAEKAIAKLSVDQVIQKGGYGQSLPEADGKSGLTESKSVLAASKSGGDATTSAEEQSLLDKLAAEPAEVGHYFALSEYYGRLNRLADSERVLTRALAAAGGDLHVRERLEDAQLRRIRHQVEVAISRAKQDRTEESLALARRMEQQANQSELEIFAARVQREPASTDLQYELGMRFKRAAKYREAIQAFQAARTDYKRKSLVEIHLGECFQQIRQFTLASASYEAAVSACDDTDLETKKLALYRAGTLWAELKDIDRAEKYLTDLAAIDFAYRDVADRLDKLAQMRDNA